MLPHASLDDAHVVPDGVVNVCARLAGLKGRVHKMHEEREAIICFL
jgi:hypothetical protein